MGKVVNLRTMRKRAARDAELNRVLYGISKSERLLAKVRTAKTDRDLERHRIEKGERL
jgi:hypothetical protein